MKNGEETCMVCFLPAYVHTFNKWLAERVKGAVAMGILKKYCLYILVAALISVLINCRGAGSEVGVGGGHRFRSR